jgi:formate hydrogenlyase transcriptional activator
MRDEGQQESSSHPSSITPHPSKTLAEAEREHILGALRETGWVVAGPKGAAARLGMKRSTLQEKMRKLGISGPSSGGPELN